MLRILAFGQLINVATGSVGYLLSMTGHERLLRNTVLIAAVVSLGGGLTLIPAFGLTGAALATATGLAVQNLLCVWQVRRVLGFNTLAIWRFASAPRVDQQNDQPTRLQATSPPTHRPKPNLQVNARSMNANGLPSMSIFFILMTILSLILSVTLALTYWPESLISWGEIDPDTYRESILWALGGVLTASLFAAFARLFYDLNRLVTATASNLRQDLNHTED